MTALAAEFLGFWRLVPPRDRLRFRLAGGGGVVLLLVLFINTQFVQPLRWAAKGSAAKQSLHEIQLAIERFAVDSPDSTYPLAVSELVGSGYLPRMPLNVYTGEPMREYPLDVARLPPGDFVYYKRYPQAQPQAGEKPSGYTLALGEFGLQSLRESIARRGS